MTSERLAHESFPEHAWTRLDARAARPYHVGSGRTR
jgi:hypothetical protein